MADLPAFQLFSFSSDLLGSYFNARTVTRTVAAIQNTSRSIERGPAVQTPWDLAEQNPINTLAGRFNAVRGKTDFIDLNSSSFNRNQSKDEKALFTLYRALSDLKTIADYSAEKSTPTALLARLSSQFRGGLGQAQDFIRDAELEKLTLMFGAKEPRVVTDVPLGKNDRDILGATLSVSSKTQELSNLSGTEVFTLNIDKTTDSDDIVIDLSQITDTLNLTNLVSYFNQQITAVTTLDTEGNPVSKYQSRFSVEEVSSGKFALKLETGSGEAITLSAQTPEPALYVTGSHKDVGSSATETATLSKLRDLSAAGPITEFSQKIAGTDYANALPPLTDDDGKVIESEGELFETRANASAVDSQGNVYVVGSTKGDFGRQINAAETQDVFLTKYDAAGNALFSRLLGASDQAEAFDIAIDSNDNVFVAGQVNDELVSSDVLSGLDSFVIKYDQSGEELWTHQQDTVATDQANSLAIDSSGDVVVVGSILGRLNSGTTHGGGSDIFVTKLSGTDGSLSASAQIGGADAEYGEAVALAGDGNFLIASRESGRVIVRKLDAADPTIELANYDLGDLGGGTVSDITVDAAGDIYVTGTSVNGSLSGGTVTNAHSGDADGFVTKLSDGGNSFSADWTHFLGSSGSDRIEGVTVENGAVYVAGKTNGTLPGAVKSGTTNGFAAKIDSTSGAADWVRQFGGVSGYNGSSSVAFSATGSSVLTKLGLPTGLYDNSQTRDIETQTSARAGDHFFVSVNGGREQKITILEGDDYASLARRIKRTSYRFIEAVQTIGTNGPELKIETREGATVDIIAGKGSRDALIKLGIQPAKILPSEKIFAIGEDSLGTDPDNLGGVFALELLSGFSLRSKNEAEYVSAQIDKALETVKRAFRSLTYDPIKAQILKDADSSSGPVSPYLLSRISNYQDGLNRLSAISGGFSI